MSNLRRRGVSELINLKIQKNIEKERLEMIYFSQLVMMTSYHYQFYNEMEKYIKYYF